MSRPNPTRVQAIFHEAVEAGASGREALLDLACGGDALLRSHVEALLAQVDEAPDFLEGGAASLNASEPVVPPREIAGYRVGTMLGTGTMGAVFEAEQRSPRRAVALKLLQPWNATPEGVRRLRHEAEFLGRLQHPGIARIYEAGLATIEGADQPFLVMELVRGRPLNEHAAAGLDRRERLELLARVCDAVEHAHRRGVVHCDLKPANILVEPKDDRIGQPKILDFGIAVALEATSGGAALTGRITGTPAYMSPEQARGEAALVGEPSDVFALGAILFELLTGRPMREGVPATSWTDLRAAAESEPRPPSCLDRMSRGDLDSIFLRATASRPLDRYPSAQAMAADIRAHLAHLPISARAAGPAERIIRLARRHPGRAAGLAGAVTVLLVLIVGGYRELWRAQQESQRRGRMLAFMADALAAADPFGAGADRSAVNLVRELDARIGQHFADDPAAEAELRIASARTLLALGAHAEAEASARRARDLFGPRDAAAIEARAMLGRALNELGRYAEAEAVLADAAEVTPGARDWRLSEQLGIALLHQPARLGDGIECLVAALGSLDADAPDRVAAEAQLRSALAWAYYESDRFTDAEPLYRELLAHQRTLGERELLPALETANSLAGTLSMLDRLVEADELGTFVLAELRGRLPTDHPLVLRAANTLGVICEGRGDLVRAATLYAAAAAGSRDDGPDPTPARRAAAANQARVRLCLGEITPAQAEPVLRDALALAESASRRSLRGRWRMTYARCLLSLGREEEARTELLLAQGDLRAVLPEDHRWLREVASLLSP